MTCYYHYYYHLQAFYVHVNLPCWTNKSYLGTVSECSTTLPFSSQSQSQPHFPHAFLPDNCATTHHQRMQHARTPITPPPPTTLSHTAAALHHRRPHRHRPPPPRYATAHATAATTTTTARPPAGSSSHAPTTLRTRCADRASRPRKGFCEYDDYE